MPTLTVVPDQIGLIVAYRAWRYVVDRRRVRVGALGEDDGAWDGSRQAWAVARCRVQAERLAAGGRVPLAPHVAPDERCSCGFYSVKAIEVVAGIVGSQHRVLQRAMADRRVRASRGVDEAGIVLGRVELAGRVIEHEFGYRAQRARMLELIPIGGDDEGTCSVPRRLELPVADPFDGPTRRPARRGDPGGTRNGRHPAPRSLSRTERLRLVTHWRHFRVIRGGAAPDRS